MARTTTSATEIPTRVLVLGMAQVDGTIAGDELYPVAAACGQTPDQVRSCLRRLVTEGLFVRRGAGSGARFDATEAGLAALGATLERTRLAWGQDAAGRGWDRQWRLVGFAVPEARRRARDAFRDQLIALGGSSVQGGLYASPHPWHNDVVAVAERLGVREQITLVTTDELDVCGVRDPRELARRLWPIDDLARRYERFVDEHSRVPDVLEEMRRRRERLPDTAFLPGALRMAVRIQEIFESDPLLPPELLPRPWPGRTARDLLVRSRRLALATREGAGRPALFRLFDDAIASLA